MRFCTFSSSSSGNAALLSCGSTHLLVDAGISYTRIRSGLGALGLSVGDLTAVFITHAHGDHTAGLATCLKRHRDIPIRCSEETARQLCYRFAGIDQVLIPFPLGGRTAAGCCTVTSIPTSHDAPGSTGYRFDGPEGSVGILTDTGILPAAARCLLGVDLLMLESNHDVETLLSGPYPYPLKDRVLGDLGHLSNETAARFACAAARSGTRQILLAHLSQENNTPQMALNTVGRALEAIGYAGALAVAPRDRTLSLQVGELRTAAPQSGQIAVSVGGGAG